MSNPSLTPGRVLGIGGIFFKSPDHDRLRGWYSDHLGFQQNDGAVMFNWRAADNPDTERLTVWSVFPANTTYFGPSDSRFMINYIVDDLDAILSRLAAAGVRIDPKRDDYDYGRFAWIYDPDGNKIELWQPLTPA